VAHKLGSFPRVNAGGHYDSTILVQEKLERLKSKYGKRRLKIEVTFVVTHFFQVPTETRREERVA
jgi:hypothetical protein